MIFAEVVDMDEGVYRQGYVSPQLYGYLRVPYLNRYIQGVNAPSASTFSGCLRGIAEDISIRIKLGTIYIKSPGSSKYTIAKNLGLKKRLIGVDVYLDGKMVASDANESTLLDILASNQPIEIIVTPISGQRCIFGRGNQQINHEVIR